MDNLIQKLGDGLAARSARQEFWVRFLILMMANAVLGFLLGMVGVWPELIGFVTLPLWLYIAARRFHDLGLTGWLGLIPFAGGVAIGFLSGFGLLPPEIATPLLTFGPVGITLVIVLWLGCAPGQRQTNRFGPPPGQDNPADVF